LAAGFLAGAFVAAGFTALAAGFAALGAALAAGFAALAATLGAALAAGFAAAFLAGAFFAAIDSHLPSVPMGHSDEIQKDRTENPNRQIRTVKSGKPRRHVQLLPGASKDRVCFGFRSFRESAGKETKVNPSL